MPGLEMGQSTELDSFLNLHRDQLMAHNVPQMYWSTLYQKLKSQIFDSGNYFQIVKIEYDQEREPHEPVWALQSLQEIEVKDPRNIFLIDHCWTYKINEARSVLRNHPNLRFRLCNMFDIDTNLETEDMIEALFTESWKYNNTYAIGQTIQVEDRVSVWYVMDELGTAVMHSETPNCRIVPFFYIEDQIAYSLLFPCSKIEIDEIVCRDFADGISNPKLRKAELLQFYPDSFDEEEIEAPIPDEDYFLSGHIKETLPEETKIEKPKGKLKVYSQYSIINEFLTDNKFEVVNNEEEADILWLIEHFKDYDKLSPHKFVNQFPFEFVLTVKDLLCMTCRQKKPKPSWFPTTYNLKSEVNHVISCFRSRQKAGLDNHWICKPFNLARGLDICISNNIYQIVKLMKTGPKIVQKYVSNPVLINFPECGKVKFDIRYVVLLKSVEPLQVYIYKNFFLRFANEPFELRDFDCYEKHFTVMNYTEGAQLKRLLCDEFKLSWIEQYEEPWDSIEDSISKMLKQVFELAVLRPPPCGIAKNPQSRALYACDLMLEHSEGKIQPKILEINFMPDCKRACEYYPDFYNNIFTLLFTEEEPQCFLKL